MVFSLPSIKYGHWISTVAANDSYKQCLRIDEFYSVVPRTDFNTSIIWMVELTNWTSKIISEFRIMPGSFFPHHLNFLISKLSLSANKMAEVCFTMALWFMIAQYNPLRKFSNTEIIYMNSNLFAQFGPLSLICIILTWKLCIGKLKTIQIPS